MFAPVPRQTFSPEQFGSTPTKMYNTLSQQEATEAFSNTKLGVGLILGDFSNALFQTIEQALLEVITYKTLVLLSLALWARHGELITPSVVTSSSFNHKRMVFHFTVFGPVVYFQDLKGKTLYTVL